MESPLCDVHAYGITHFWLKNVWWKSLTDFSCSSSGSPTVGTTCLQHADELLFIAHEKGDSPTPPHPLHKNCILNYYLLLDVDIVL